MGMDMYIDKIKRCPTDKSVILERAELVYWRKFWDLHNYLGLYEHDDYGIDVRMTKEDVEKCLDFCCHNRDFFGTFGTVADVCELLNEFDDIEKAGWEVVYNANW